MADFFIKCVFKISKLGYQNVCHYSFPALANINRITIEDFINNNKVSTRLSNILQATKSDYSTGRRTQSGKWFDYIDEVEESDFRKIRNAGNKSWNEFKSLLLNNKQK